MVLPMRPNEFRPAFTRSDGTLLVATGALTVWSAIVPKDYATWFFELLLGAIGVAVLVVASRRVRFSGLVYAVVALHYAILAVGAKYTYAEEPVFSWIRDVLELERNHFDRVGHFAQGVTPALLTREALLRWTSIGRSRWVPILSVSVALAFSALYEILEWAWVVLFYPDKGPEWLGHQGDPFDAQADMLMALAGGMVVVSILRRLHDASIVRREASERIEPPAEH